MGNKVLYHTFKEEQRENLRTAFPNLLKIELVFLLVFILFDRLRIRTVYSAAAVSLPVLLAAAVLLLRRFAPVFFGRRIDSIHAGIFLAWNGAAALLVYLLVSLPEQDLRWLAAGAGVYFVVMGFCFLTAFPIRLYLPLLLALPLAGLFLVLFLKGQFRDYSILITVFLTLAWILCSGASLAAERLYYQEFRMRFTAERRREKAAEQLHRAEVLNTRLEETTDKLMQEIEERKAVEKSLEQFAAFDELTSVYNRRAGLEVLKEALHYAERKEQNLTVAFVDLDDLKTVNDNFGHRTGDAYLREVVALLRKHLRKSDSISRYGGDEFLLILIECAEDEARNIFNRIKEDMRAMNEGDRLFPISFSYGFAEAGPGNRERLSELISRADAMMYLDKQRKHR
ncbi:MAG: GGDEF domain-containing protein [Sediminispirochaetaceae bacterium]